jgi:hypothetical protein
MSHRGVLRPEVLDQVLQSSAHLSDADRTRLDQLLTTCKNIADYSDRKPNSLGRAVEYHRQLKSDIQHFRARSAKVCLSLDDHARR